jgi:predicted MFS family arabinose efflux permease
VPAANKYVLFALSCLLIIFGFPGQSVGICALTDQIIASSGISRNAFGIVYMCATISGCFLVLTCGSAVDKFGIRRTTLLSLALCAAVFFAIGSGDFFRKNLFAGGPRGIVHYAIFLYACLSIMRFLGQNMLPMQGRLQIIRSFSKNRGTAIAVTGIFAATTTGLAPRMMRFLSNRCGWENAYAALAIVAVVLLAVFYFLFRDGGDGKNSKNAAFDAGRSAAVGIFAAKRELLKMPIFWCMLLPLCFNSFIGTGTTVHITDIFRESGAGERLAVDSYAYLCAVSLVSGILFGRQLDKNRIKFCVLSLLLSQIFGLIGLEFSKNVFWFAIYVFCIGCSWGSYNILRTAAWSKIFCEKNIGSVLGLVYFCSATVGAVSASLMSYCMSLTGSYFPLIHAVECAIAAVAIFVGRKFPGGICPASNP